MGLVLDASTMSFDQLLRMGIAEAKLAAVVRPKRKRGRHLYISRALLMAALRRCDTSDPEIKAHLLAVLLKLGEDPRAVQRIIAESDSKPQGESHERLRLAPAVETSTDEAEGEIDADTPSVSSESTVIANEVQEHWEVVEMSELVLDDNENNLLNSDNVAAFTEALDLGDVMNPVEEGAGRDQLLVLSHRGMKRRQGGGAHSHGRQPSQSCQNSPASNNASSHTDSESVRSRPGCGQLQAKEDDERRRPSVSQVWEEVAFTMEERFPRTCGDRAVASSCLSTSADLASPPERAPSDTTRFLCPRGPLGVSGSPGIQSLGSVDIFSMGPSAVPSLTATPVCDHLTTRPAAAAVSVRIRNGVSGEEEVRFAVPVHSQISEHHFLQLLDRLCQQHANHPLSALNWLSHTTGDNRYQRRRCDAKMVKDLFGEGEGRKTGLLVLQLCTVPVTPPSELPASKVKLKNVSPTEVIVGARQPVRMQLYTSFLKLDHVYTVAFTHQWSNVTFAAQATVLPNQKGVELTLPGQMLRAAGDNTDGLYNVHLVIDNAFRSQNRRTLTVGSSDSELSSTTTTHSSSFEPIPRSGDRP